MKSHENNKNISRFLHAENRDAEHDHSITTCSYDIFDTLLLSNGEIAYSAVYKSKKFYIYISVDTVMGTFEFSKFLKIDSLPRIFFSLLKVYFTRAKLDDSVTVTLLPYWNF